METSSHIPPANTESSFGIQKIVDCKIGQDGKQMYKVKWEPTWEPFENLASCQHLIDEFWSFVNKAKSTEQASYQHRKRARLELSAGNEQNVINLDADFDQHRLSEDNKAGVQRLIARTQSSGSAPNLMSPSEMLNYPQHNMMNIPRTPTRNNTNFMAQSPNQGMLHQSPGMPPQSPNHVNNKMPNFGSPQQFNSPGQSNFGSPSQRGKSAGFGNKGGMKPEVDDNIASTKSSNQAISASSLKYLENFSNPYVKIIIVCKICNKEQSLKFSGNWRQHYLTHASSEGKPHKCQHCSKSYIRADQLRKHVSKYHEQQEQIYGQTKQEQHFVVKNEF
ncbi:fez family zinc finger protein erm-like isoform X3 [Hydractinia symbiolongicarpus]|uniref:fez family zinc finger protein erm-like isoform X3 n=1 Tax=Hydractinia symbiolongicarpus TaxID=13093 RepID=UPI00254D98E6|nr:fez family zinc finger protein erm-like isoform X3 [Hydractinia symbiolongicarpus]